MAQRSYLRLLWVLALGGLALDQASKYGVFAWLYPPPDWVAQATRRDDTLFHYEGDHGVIPDVFRLHAEHTNRRETGTGLLAPLRRVGGDLLPTVNKGALFGWKFGVNEDQSKEVVNGFFAAISLLAAVAIIVWGRRATTAADWPLCTSLGLILAGTLGNLYDRVVFHGVRDFLYFYWIDWPVFNVADCCLVCGACLLLLQAFWCQHAEAKAANAPLLTTTYPPGAQAAGQ